MTREEAVARIKQHKYIHMMNEPRAILISEALDMAIEALSVEPCNDCISRLDTLNVMSIMMDDATVGDDDNDTYETLDDLKQQYIEIVKGMVSVAPTPSVIEDIKAEIERVAGEENVEDTKWAAGLRYSLKIIDKYINGKESE